jgi:hypothetical protein
MRKLKIIEHISLVEVTTQVLIKRLPEKQSFHFIWAVTRLTGARRSPLDLAPSSARRHRAA